jgi:hypothetical protein
MDLGVSIFLFERSYSRKSQKIHCSDPETLCTVKRSVERNKGVMAVVGDRVHTPYGQGQILEDKQDHYMIEPLNWAMAG